MASKLKRVSEDTERTVSAIADRESRSFVAQLDRIVLAGLDALGLNPDGTPKSTRKRTPARTGK